MHTHAQESAYSRAASMLCICTPVMFPSSPSQVSHVHVSLVILPHHTYTCSRAHAHTYISLPILGLAKEYIVPGWRVGWVVVHDKSTGRLKEVKQGMKSLTQIILGMFRCREVKLQVVWYMVYIATLSTRTYIDIIRPGCCSLIQAALPALLTPAPQSKTHLDLTTHREYYMDTLLTNSNICMEVIMRLQSTIHHIHYIHHLPYTMHHVAGLQGMPLPPGDRAGGRHVCDD